jgi:hypothetical protein
MVIPSRFNFKISRSGRPIGFSLDKPKFPKAPSKETRHGWSPNSVVRWFKALYNELGYSGCSSHSGRRTFITKTAKRVYEAGGSLQNNPLLITVRCSRRKLALKAQAQHCGS